MYYRRKDIICYLTHAPVQIRACTHAMHVLSIIARILVLGFCAVLGVHRTEQNRVEGDNLVPQGTVEEERIGRYTLYTLGEKHDVFPFVTVPYGYQLIWPLNS